MVLFLKRSGIICYEPIYYVLGDGGWSRMDYEVYNGQ